MSIATQRYKMKVAQLPCLLGEAMGQPCGPVSLHHIREGQGMSQRSSDFLVIPLCKDCHQGQFGIHGDQTYLRVAKVTELDLLAECIRRLDQ